MDLNYIYALQQHYADIFRVCGYAGARTHTLSRRRTTDDDCSILPFYRFPPFSRFYMGVLELAGMVELMSSCEFFSSKTKNYSPLQKNIIKTLLKLLPPL